MTEYTTPLDDLDFSPALLAVEEEVADLLFKEARSVNAFADSEVSLEQIKAVYDLVRWGPTMMNSVPLRLLAVCSNEARVRLAAHMAEGNRSRVLAAPLSLVLAYDPEWHEELPRLAPHAPNAKEWFAEPTARAASGRDSAHMQAGYLIVGLRAAGLAVGPMNGMDADAIDEEFFSSTGWKSIMVLNVGNPTGPDAARPRAPRLEFEEITRTV